MNSLEPLEIERKFLIRYPDLNLLEQICVKKIFLVQTYLVSEKGKSRRIRKSECKGSVLYWYNEKEKISDLTRIEREREISEAEYCGLLKEMIPGSNTIIKTRYCMLDVFYDLVMDAYRPGLPYAVVLFHGAYDIPRKSSAGEYQGESEEVYKYLICCICPLVGEYEPGDPDMGFLFPAFSDRSADLDHVDLYAETPDAKKTMRDILFGTERSGIKK